MKILKHLAVGLLLLLFVYLYSRFTNNDNVILTKIIPLCILSLFLFSIMVRKIAWFKPYYTSKFNILTTKFRRKKSYDFPKNILFHKVLEVLKTSKFNIVQFDEETGFIFAASSITWFSWGENIYINIEELDNGIIMKFCSVSIFGIYTWGKNEENYYKLIDNFEESLII